MPVAPTDLQAWLSVNRPENDTDPSGGAIQDDLHASGGVRGEFTDIAAVDNVEVLSDGADTRTVTVHGRTVDGVIANENIVLSGTSPVTSVNQYERILRVILSAKDAARTVTIRRATGDTFIGSMGPNVIGLRRFFYAAASAASQKDRYELVYLKNKHATLALQSAKVTLTADPASRIKIGLEASKGTAQSLGNRVTAPSSVSFVDDGVAIDVPGTTLGAGERIGVWVLQTLPSNDPPFKNTYTLQLAGQSA